MNYAWNFVTPTPEQAAIATQLADALGIHPLLGRLLVNRGITDVMEARRFFHPQLNELLDPFLFRDMAKANPQMVVAFLLVVELKAEKN